MTLFVLVKILFNNLNYKVINNIIAKENVGKRISITGVEKSPTIKIAVKLAVEMLNKMFIIICINLLLYILLKSIGLFNLFICLFPLLFQTFLLVIKLAIIL